MHDSYEARTQWDRVWGNSRTQSKFRRLAGSIYRAIYPASSPFNYFLVSWLSHWMPLHNLVVLEIGGGGGLGLLLSRYVKKYTLLDYSEKAIEHARVLLRGRQNTECVLADMFEYSPSDKSDLVISAGLIEHFFGDEQRRCIDAHKSLSNRYVCVCAPSDIPLNWWRHYRFEVTKQYPSQRPVSEERLFNLMLDIELAPVAMTRLDPWYGRMPKGRIGRLQKACWAAYWPYKDWAIGRMDGGLVAALGELVSGSTSRITLHTGKDDEGNEEKR